MTMPTSVSSIKKLQRQAKVNSLVNDWVVTKGPMPEAITKK